MSPPPPWPAMVAAFGHIGVASFGGPAAQIAVMRRELVERRGWIDDATFLRGLGFCTLLPGPEAMQLATFAGWRMRGWRGGVLAGLLFVLPGAAVMIALSALYVAFGRVEAVEAAFLGVKAAVLAIVATALWKLRVHALSGPLAGAVAVGAFTALLLDVPFPVVIGAALAVGLLRPAAAGEVPAASGPAYPIRATLRTVAVWLAVWWAPLLPVLLFAPGTPPAEAAALFSWLAAVSFGGAYALLAALAQYAVEGHGWLTPEAMIDGLGLAETTPGPLVLVTVFAGWLGGAAAGGWPVALATAGVTLWATFAPCFLWIFAGAPYVERLADAPRIGAALGIVTAAVAGVIASLAVRFGAAVLLGGDGPGGLDAGAAILAGAAAALLWSGRARLLPTLGTCAAGGLALHLLAPGG
ncbi:chromate efflux transporter [Jannaschia sp. W003]|uniref:chromate efflux transporter n=1 Tax=Jannaschia sp. W003 TaxID=2867012 RepID=UPI0021A69181|nr:chromate efflux transporter [Jannaschia sp. W003]UWQ20756.1 chromate efflux transporter [Jannaschia sp. W003]